MTTNLDFKISTLQDYEVVGHGRMITKPCQIGEWWVMPLKDYKGKIPQEFQQRLDEYLASHPKAKGVLVCEDMEKIRKDRELQRQKQEARKQAAINTLTAVGRAFGAMVLVLFYLLTLPLMAIDPMLVVVDEKEDWRCLGIWFD